MMKIINFTYQVILLIFFVTSISLLLVPSFSYADLPDTAILEKHRNDAKNRANSLSHEVHDFLYDANKTNQAKEIMGYETDQPTGSGMSLNDAEMHGAQNLEQGSNDPDYKYACTKKKCEVGHTLSSEATLNRSDKIKEAMVIRDENGNVIGHKSYIDNILDHQQKAAIAFEDAIHGNKNVCTPITDTFTKTTPDTCDSYYDYNVNSCYPRQIVEIDPKYNYACNKKREIKEKVCSDKIVSITCKKTTNCGNGGIKPGSLGSGLAYNHQNGVITIGTIRDNDWPGDWVAHDRTTTFTTVDVSKIDEFRITSVGFDDYLQIKVNGHNVYVGPDGGNKLEIIRKGIFFYIDNGISLRRDCERGTNWRRNVDIDLKPYLKEGENIIETRLIVCGQGEFWMKINAKAKCCNEDDWDIKREETCEYH